MYKIFHQKKEGTAIKNDTDDDYLLALPQIWDPIYIQYLDTKDNLYSTVPF